MAKDDPLRSKLASLATASQGRVTFNVRTSRERSVTGYVTNGAGDGGAGVCRGETVLCAARARAGANFTTARAARGDLTTRGQT